MIRTQVIEVSVEASSIVGAPPRMKEVELGWTLMHEVPVEKRIPDPRENPQPLAIKINDVNYFVIGHSWTVKTAATLVEAGDLDPCLVLIVQRVPVSPGGLVTTPGATMDQVKALVPEPGKKRLQN